MLDFDIKNIVDNNDKYCFLNWLDRNLGELIVDTCGNVENNLYIRSEDYNIDYEMMAISKLDRVIDNIMQDVKQSAINKDYEMSNVDATNFRKIDDIIKNLNNNCKKVYLI